MPYPILVVECSCGYKDRSSEFEFGGDVKCPGRIKDGCGNDLIVKMAASRYPTMFRRGQVVTLFVTPEALALPVVKDYPIRAYHKMQVTVLADGPDDEGLVDVKLPTPYKNGDQVIRTLPVLHGLLG